MIRRTAIKWCKQVTWEDALRLFDFDSATSINEKDLKNTYKQLSIKHHPDTGGSADDFKVLVSAKNLLQKELLSRKNTSHKILPREKMRRWRDAQPSSRGQSPSSPPPPPKGNQQESHTPPNPPKKQVTPPPDGAADAEQRRKYREFENQQRMKAMANISRASCYGIS